MSQSGLLLPDFFIQGRPIQYVHENKYLGFWLTSTLSSDVHMKKLLTKLRKAILMFRSSCKIRQRTLLLTIAQTYIVPVMHNLEFVGRVKRAQNLRFDYLLRRYFNFKSASEYTKLKRKYKFLNLETLHANARQRFHNDFWKMRGSSPISVQTYHGRRCRPFRDAGWRRNALHAVRGLVRWAGRWSTTLLTSC